MNNLKTLSNGIVSAYASDDVKIAMNEYIEFTLTQYSRYMPEGKFGYDFAKARDIKCDGLVLLANGEVCPINKTDMLQTLQPLTIMHTKADKIEDVLTYVTYKGEICRNTVCAKDSIEATVQHYNNKYAADLIDGVVYSLPFAIIGYKSFREDW